MMTRDDFEPAREIECSVSGAACLRRCGGRLGPAWADQLLVPKDMNVPLDQIAPPDHGTSEPSGQAGAKYGGVTPGSNVSNPLPQSPQSPPHLIWTGFQPTATGRVFFSRLRGQWSSR